MLDLGSTQQKINDLVTAVGSMSRAYSDVFFNDTPQDVDLDILDENGDIVSVSVPNMAKVRQGLVFPAAYYRDVGWSVKGTVLAADRATLRSPDSLWLDIGGAGYRLESYVLLDINVSANWDSTVTDYTLPANRKGKDFYVYACVPAGGTSPFLILSANASYPAGFTADNSRKIAGFHCLCADILHSSSLTAWAAGTAVAQGETRRAVSWDGYIYRCIEMGGGNTGGAEPAWSGLAVGDTIADGDITWVKEKHDLEGFLAGDILPASVWDLSHRPQCSPEGMVWSSAAQLWIDIYLQSGTGSSSVSAYGATITDTRSWIKHVDDMGAVGKQILTDTAFQVAAAGSNEESSWTDDYENIPTTTGGHVDMYGRRMLSHIGLEDMTGIRTQMLKETAQYLLNETLLGGSLWSLDHRGLIAGYGIADDMFWNAAGANEFPPRSFTLSHFAGGGLWSLTFGSGSCCRSTFVDKTTKAAGAGSRGCSVMKHLG